MAVPSVAPLPLPLMPLRSILAVLELEEKLGCGADGTTWRCRWRASPAAVKLVISRNAEALSNSSQEALFARALAHPFVVQCYAVLASCLTEDDFTFLDQTAEDLPAAGSYADADEAAAGGPPGQQRRWQLQASPEQDQAEYCRRSYSHEHSSLVLAEGQPPGRGQGQPSGGQRRQRHRSPERPHSEAAWAVDPATPAAMAAGSGAAVSSTRAPPDDCGPTSAPPGMSRAAAAPMVAAVPRRPSPAGYVLGAMAPTLYAAAVRQHSISESQERTAAAAVDFPAAGTEAGSGPAGAVPGPSCGSQGQGRALGRPRGLAGTVPGAEAGKEADTDSDTDEEVGLGGLLSRSFFGLLSQDEASLPLMVDPNRDLTKAAAVDAAASAAHQILAGGNGGGGAAAAPGRCSFDSPPPSPSSSVLLEGGSGAAAVRAAVRRELRRLGAAPGAYLTCIVMDWCDYGTLHELFATAPEPLPPALSRDAPAQLRLPRSLLASPQSGDLGPEGLGSSVSGSLGEGGGGDGRRRLAVLLRCALEVAQGLAYLHSMGVAHGDLGPKNVLLKSSATSRRGFTCKLADFGRSGPAGRAGDVQPERWGSLPYMAPDALTGRGTAQQADVYSFGVLLWYMATGRKPHQGMRPAQLLVGLASGELELAWPEWADPWVACLGAACTRLQPELRPSMAQVATQLGKRLRRGGSSARRRLKQQQPAA
ncbi:hypothetical protein GPECTOR_9g422 [Gonium pectorale]|uniref:Protein kinase domain-containing protein n=1 Tax=Gonium pectorale TaxID=33097 RepID=A0A150GRL5_GONPE|nr:hypothetical protein GPECTOR_9g422 [Gonium pectorale]|eukprot:KXZ52378.1 hypothetical protein GPECTOR_9g422 [Gonium pectorale]